MKKIIVFLMTLAGVTAAQADGYGYLTFETTDGAKASVEVSSLRMTINGNTLKAGSQTFTLSNLSKMYFTTTDESSETGIEVLDDLTKEALTTDAEMYDLNGRRIVNRPSSHRPLPHGAYIVKAKDKTYKIIVK